MPLRFVVALEFEARPLIARYGLEREASESAFKTFRRDDVALIVSGPGKLASAAATAYLHARTGVYRQAAWINAGIAGSSSVPVGEAVLAHKILDRSSGQSWYPPLLFAPRVTTGQVTTVDGVEREFADDGAYEMEASGFYSTAIRFSTSELVQCLKIVSDGPGERPERLTPRDVVDLIDAQLEPIGWLAEETLRLSEEVRRLDSDPPELSDMLRRWHFTVTERRQLRRLLERWHTLGAERPLPEDDWARLRRGKDVVRHFRRWIDARPTLPGGPRP